MNEPFPDDVPSETGLTRRSWFGQAAGGLLGNRPSRADLVPRESRETDGFLVRNHRPLDLETPVSALDREFTPNDRFFVRSHFGAPAVGRALWDVEIGGLVDRPLTLTTADLGKFAPRKIAAVLQCSGNGRANFQPKIPGVAWDRGAVGNAEWSGVRLAEVLQQAGLKSDSAHVHFLGADGPPSPKTPLFFRSIPLEKALHPDTLLAIEMNGEPVPVLHGGPLRLIVPGWAGSSWTKWVRTITVAAEEAPGFYMQTGYRMPRTPLPPDAVVNPRDLVPVTAMNVKSLITWPIEATRLSAGPIEIRGFAWTGEGQVDRVEVSISPDIAWRVATLLGEPKPWAWRPWKFTRDVKTPGPIVIRARATDSQGETQPESTPWNRSGYLWNGIDRVTCEVA